MSLFKRPMIPRPLLSFCFYLLGEGIGTSVLFTCWGSGLVLAGFKCIRLRCSGLGSGLCPGMGCLTGSSELCRLGKGSCTFVCEWSWTVSHFVNIFIYNWELALMSASHKYELALHIKSLRNIGIRQACYLQIRTTVFHCNGNKQVSFWKFRILLLHPMRLFKPAAILV